MKIGVLSIQGAVSEHLDMLIECGMDGLGVKKPADFSDLDGLIIPGGESTTISRLAKRYGIIPEIKRMAAEGKPIMGTCAGQILLASDVEGQEGLLSLMDITVRRNAFGRQKESFEEDLLIAGIEEDPYRCIFIRAPIITRVGPQVEVLASYGEGVVAARQANILALSFHPELTSDLRMHKYFLSLTKDAFLKQA